MPHPLHIQLPTPTAPRHLRAIVLLGYGNIGQALTPLLRRRFPALPIDVVDERMAADQVAIAEAHQLRWTRLRVTRDNHAEALAPLVAAGTLVINVATSIGSHDLIDWAQQRGANYLDTCIDPWSYQDGELDSAANTNYRMREAVLALQASQRGQRQPTAVVAHGANPGMVSVLVKEALLMMAREHLAVPAAPCSAVEWALLAESLGVRVIQIAERDSQRSDLPRGAHEFVNTWSVDGFVAEALQPAELGWGSHEATGPMAARARHHASGCGAAVYLDCMGVAAQVRTWTPAAGDFVGRLISHNEAISLASFLTVPATATVAAAEPAEPAAPRYRPTVYYAYHPCDQAMDSLDLLACGHRDAIASSRVLKDELVDGIDELGVRLISDRHPSLWLGSQLSIERARAIAPHNNATSLQVVGSMLAAIEWLDGHPHAGIVESEALDHDFILQHARPYWEPIVHAWHRVPAPAGDAAPCTLDAFWVGA
ncbi:MAG: saccharopine dehydrogenase NADP-binding domain-containing protein [Leptothrix sp. (in: b-proteobacteria)]